MFEKEAKEYATVGWDKSSDSRDVFVPRIDEIKFNDWRNGAEFGYNKCFEQIRKIVNEHTRLDCIIPELLRLKEIE